MASHLAERIKWSIGAENEYSKMTDKRMQQIKERKEMLNQLETLVHICPTDVAKYLLLHTRIGLDQQRALLSVSPMHSSWLDLSRFQLNRTQEFYDNFRSKFGDYLSVDKCSCLRRVTQKDEKIYGESKN